MEIVILLIGIILIIVGIVCLIKAKSEKQQTENIKTSKQREIAAEQEQVNRVKNERKRIEQDINDLQEKANYYQHIQDQKVREFNSLQEKYDNKQKDMNKLSEELYELEKNKTNCIEEIKQAKRNYVEIVEKTYDNIEADFHKNIKAIQEETQDKVAEANIQIDAVEFELQKIKASLTAGIKAQLREQEEQEKLDFYKLKVGDKTLKDIEILNTVKTQLSQPTILCKLIWTTFFQKQTNELCNRVLGNTTVTGIYKITNLVTKKVYIGQSVNIADRWKSHIKCGLGIDTSPTNRLYQAMLKDGVWNFTFELLEECTREELNEKEKLFIDLYQSDEFGYNSTCGGS